MVSRSLLRQRSAPLNVIFPQLGILASLYLLYLWYLVVVIPVLEKKRETSYHRHLVFALPCFCISSFT